MASELTSSRFTPVHAQANPLPSETVATGAIDKKIGLLRNNIGAVTAETFRGEPKVIQSAVLAEGLVHHPDVDIYEYLPPDAQAKFFDENKAYRENLRRTLCPLTDLGEGRVVLKVKENSFEGNQICKLLAGLSTEDKARVTELDLSQVRRLKTLQGKEHSALEGFTSLRKLTLPKDPFYTNPAGIGAVGNSVVDLDISGSGITSLSFLQSFPHLQTLTGEDCSKLKDLQGKAGGIASCKDLQQLTLTKISNVTNFKPLAELGELVQCNLEGTRSLKDLAPFRNLPHLRELHIAKTRVTAEETLGDQVQIFR